MSASFFAEYSDGSRYQVVYDPGERKTYLRTTSGNKMDVPRFVNGAEFVAYAFDYTPQPGLRGCDWAQNINRLHAHLALLTPPAKPAAPSPIQQSQPEDFRLHLEADSDPFRALQATGAKGEAQYRGECHRARQQALQTLNEPDAHKIQDARRIQTEYAALKRPRGGGQFLVKNSSE